MHKKWPSDRERIASKRKAHRGRNHALLQQLRDVPCADCGHKFPTECMDFDHVRGEKKFNVCQEGIWCGVEKLLEEIAKCDIVCANCHRIRTKARFHDETNNS